MDPHTLEASRSKPEAEGSRAEVGFLIVDQGFSSIQGTLFAFYMIEMVFDAWSLLSTVEDPNRIECAGSQL